MLPLTKPSLFCLIITSLISTTVKSAEFFEYGQSIRALGMGNAYSAVAKDGDSLFYNPAGLGRSSGINLTLLNMNLGLNGENAYNTVQKVSQSTGTGVDKFSEIFGEQLWLGAGGKVTLTLPNFGMGIYDSGSSGIELKDPILPYFDINYVNDYGIVVGSAFKIGPHSHFGINAKRINRTGGQQDFGISTFLNGDTQTIQDNIQKKGVGYGADIGFSWEIPAPFNPVVSGVWKDIGTTTFLKVGGSEKPPRILDDQTIGVAAGFDLALFGLTTAIDIKHINATSEPFGKKLHMGLELDLPLLDLRGGFSQGYYSIGASVDLLLMQLDLAYYGVELGEYPGQDEDRRILLALTMDLGFDANLNFLDFNSSKGKRLKRRR
ncbi:MAG: hypothetical protein RJB66_623 [Pseudomonadota bacterium]|jgi:hypothetical protein